MRHSVTAMNELTFRRATVEDAELLARMETENFSDPWDVAAFENILRNPAVYFTIIEHCGTPVAYGGMTVVVDECDIINIAVDKSMRRQGIGRILVTQMLDICKELGVVEVFLEHRESNTPAAALYEGFGFVPYGVRKRYYTSPTEDAVLRKLTI